MVKDLLNLDESKLLFTDIETVRAKEFIDEDSPEWKDFRWKMRNKDTDKLPYVEETKELYKRKAALYPIYSKIVSITVGFISNEKIILKTYSGEEKDILREFVDMVKGNVGFTQVYWNMGFDIPTVRKRFFINRLTDYLPDASGNDSMKKPWTIKGLLDLMDVWKGISFYNDSMSEVATAMGLESPKDEFSGFEVSDKYYEGKIDEIINYNQKDVKTLINLYRVFTEKEPIYDVVVKSDEKSAKKKQTETTVEKPVETDINPLEVSEDKTLVLKRIFINNEITKEDKKELVSLIGKKRLYKKDKPILIDMIHSLSVNSDMFSKDPQKVVDEKLKTVEELINSL